MVAFDSIPTAGAQEWQDVSQPSSLKFGLFVKTHEMRSLEESLRQVVVMPRAERMKWLMEHQDFVNDILDSYIADSVLALDGLQLDSEGMRLAIEFVTELRDVMNVLRSIIDSTRSFSS